MPFVSKLFPKWHCKRLLRTDPLKALVIGGFVRGLSMRDVESLCEEAGLGKTSKSTVSRICAELHERFEAFCRRSLYEVNLVVLFLDAIYLPVRPSGPKEGVICAWGITENGERALVSVRLGMRETKEDWLELGRDLTTRGLAAPRLVVADGAAGLTLGDRGDLAARRPPALRRSPPAEPPGEAPQVRAGPDPLQLLVSAHRRDLGQGRQAPPPGPDLRTRACRLRVGRPLPLRRPRRPGRAPALPTQTPRTVAVNEPARTVARGGPPAHQGDGPLPRRDQLPLTRLGGARPVLQPRQQRRHVHRRRPPTPLPNQIPASRPRHPRRGGHRRINSPTGTSNRERIYSGKGTQPSMACFPRWRGSRCPV